MRRQRSLVSPLTQVSIIVIVAMIAISAVVYKSKFEMRQAAENGDIVTLQKLLALKINPNSVDILANGMTPLLAAASAGRPHTGFIRKSFQWAHNQEVCRCSAIRTQMKHPQWNRIPQCNFRSSN
jgi:hypothetical protein